MWNGLRSRSSTAKRGGAVELVVIVATALFFALAIQAYAVKPYRIPSPSMLPTLHIGDRVLVNRLAHRLGADPKVGQITVFTPPQGAQDSQCGVPGEGPFYTGPPLNTDRHCSPKCVPEPTRLSLNI